MNRFHSTAVAHVVMYMYNVHVQYTCHTSRHTWQRASGDTPLEIWPLNSTHAQKEIIHPTTGKQVNSSAVHLLRIGMAN